MTRRRLAAARATSASTSGPQRRLQIALGWIWLIDAALQLQPFMFERAFVTHVIAPNETGQPGFVAGPIQFVAHLVEPRIALFNVFAVAIQALIGVGLLYRPTVRPALVASFGWALGVWWVGEGLGGLLTGEASPLTGAPGAAILYVFAGLIAWPAGRSETTRRSAGGLLGERGALGAWALLWLGSAALWLVAANRADAAVKDAVASAPSGAAWLSSLQSSVATATAGHGAAIAAGTAGLSGAIGLAAFSGRLSKAALALSAALALVYFIIGQGLGGVLTGSGTDPGTGPLLLLLAISIYPIQHSRRAHTPRLRWTVTDRTQAFSPARRGALSSALDHRLSPRP